MQTELPDFSPVRALVIGDLMLDRYWQGPVSRISPEAPVPVVLVDEIEERPGGAANVAFNMADLGVEVSLAGMVGTDEAGHTLRALLEREGVHCRFQSDESISTITKLRVLSRHQQLIRLDFEQNLQQIDSSLLEEIAAEQLADSDILLLSDYAKGTLNDPQRFINLARARSIPVLVDPKGTDFTRYRGATLLTPNLHEFESAVGPCENDRQLNERGEQLRRELRLDALLLTLSERGMLLIQDGSDPLHLPTRARDVYDVTGAGDTVIALLGASIAAGLNLVDAAGVANIAAGLVVGKLGGSRVSLTELRGALGKPNEKGGILDQGELLQAVRMARSEGDRIVMTNGCFDILHEGHVAYLQQARKLGDRLIIAVNSDDSVRQLKGEGRPLNPLQRRMAVLAGLASVDWVTPFNEETPERLICELEPDILVKGGDYNPDEVAGGQCAGEVRIMEYLDGCSTSEIVDALRNRNDG